MSINDKIQGPPHKSAKASRARARVKDMSITTHMVLQQAMHGRQASTPGGRASLLHPSSTSRLRHAAPKSTNSAIQVTDNVPTTRRVSHKGAEPRAFDACIMTGTRQILLRRPAAPVDLRA